MSAVDYLDKFKDTKDTGVVRFPPLTFTSPGEYRFTVRELSPSGGGWTTDLHIYPVIVTVVVGNMGQLVARLSYPKGKPTFVNHYTEKKVRPIKVCLQSKKVVCGTCLGKNKFSFSVFDQHDNVVTRAHNDQNGDVHFPALYFDQPGIYTYTIRETERPSDDWVMDMRHYSAVIKVMECGGELFATVNYPEGLPVFINRYAPRCDIACVPSSGETIYLPRDKNTTCTKGF